MNFSAQITDMAKQLAAKLRNDQEAASTGTSQDGQQTRRILTEDEV